MTSPVGGGRHEHRWLRRAATGAAFRPEQLRAHLALRLGLAQAQRDAAHGATHGAAYASFGGDHLLQKIARVHDGAADSGARNRTILHAGHRGVKESTFGDWTTRRLTNGRRVAVVLHDYPIYVLACTCLLPWRSRGVFSVSWIADSFLSVLFLVDS